MITVNLPRNMTPAEKERIRRFYTDTPAEMFDLAAFSVELGRQKTSIARTARKMGLTNNARPKTPQRRAKQASTMAQKWSENEHPRGFQGRNHSAASRRVMGDKSIAAWEAQKANGTGRMTPESRQHFSDLATARMALAPAEGAYSRCKGGRRADIGDAYFRSAWEANYARYLNWLVGRGEIERWEYEPETFWFEAIRRGVRSYKPDFRVHERGSSYFVEVKGWMDAKSKTKLRRMKKYHPGVEVRLVDKTQYASITRAVSRLIPNWE